MAETATEFPKSASERVIVKAVERGGRAYVDARIYYLADGQDGGEEWLPTKKGLYLRPDLAAEVAEALARIAREQGGGAELGGEG